METLLYEKAKEAMTLAYAPYSNFKVGAALLTKTGHIYTGCNIENSSYSLTCCAERVAIFQAIAHGHQTFQAMAVIGDTDQPISPCGACRQVMAQFFTTDVHIYLYGRNKIKSTTNIDLLLPNTFTL